MKIIRNWIILIIFTMIGSYYLYIYGQQHQIFVENVSVAEFKAPKVIVYSIDGLKETKVNSGKKSKIAVKGPSHVIKINFKTEDGTNKIIEKKFKIGANKTGYISIGGIVEGKEDWLKFENQYN
ncbi:hypothetical protein H3N56_13025 [Cetobacterium sp. 2A]|uniref:DUF6672 family protein n=1 Tax=unclassified Cetobacterium TaxID=2630983 RepID=UPI00163B9267|nr:DUF6672 family protein [Cetobacterium sp. 2A]MBC2857357.1 hypothetical protein [Cetobacterium sp. 2A]